MLVSGPRAPRGAALVRYLWPSRPPQRLSLILDAYHNDIYFSRQHRRVASGLRPADGAAPDSRPRAPCAGLPPAGPLRRRPAGGPLCRPRARQRSVHRRDPRQQQQDRHRREQDAGQQRLQVHDVLLGHRRAALARSPRRAAAPRAANNFPRGISTAGCHGQVARCAWPKQSRGSSRAGAQVGERSVRCDAGGSVRRAGGRQVAPGQDCRPQPTPARLRSHIVGAWEKSCSSCSASSP